jgi:hypothetical protein
MLAGGGAAAVDRVSILPGVMRLAACVASAVDDGVCRRWRRSSACVAEEDDEGRRVPAEATYAAWFASSLEAVVAAVATTRTAASSTPAASMQVCADTVHAEVAASGRGRSGSRGDEDDGSYGNSGNGKSGLGGVIVTEPPS